MTTKKAAKKAAPKEKKARRGHETPVGEKLNEQQVAEVVRVTAPTAQVQRRSMLVKLTISSWAAQKFDKKVTGEVETAHDVRNVGRFNKQLLAGARDKHKAVLTLIGTARITHYNESLAWDDAGWRLLPSKNFFKYTEAIRKVQSEFEVALKEFLEAYPQAREVARNELKALYNPDDYPSVDALRRRFSFDVGYAPVPEHGDFRLDLPTDQVQDIERKTMDRVQRSITGAMQDAWQRLYEQVDFIFNKLSDKDAVFRDSLVANTRALVDVLGRLNVIDDPALDDMRARVLKLVAYEPDTLRKDQAVRADVAAEAQRIMDAMKDLYNVEAL